MNEGVQRFEISTKVDIPKQINPKLPPNFDKKKWNDGVLSLKPNVGNMQTG